MDIGIIVFAYNRSAHLQQVLEGLHNNAEVNKIYVFQDGLKCEEHRNEWEKTKKVIKKINWCDVIYELSKENKGLARSIVYGINKVFEENDAVIVLEDDCVPASNFITFMTQCFEQYKDEKRIYSISGYGWPIHMTEKKYDAYINGRFSSWGWGTWKDRWEKYQVDNSILDQLNSNVDSSKRLATWGTDLEKMLLNRIEGKNDSWAVYWSLIIILMRGVCISPYCSLIKNIGFDGTGVHCGKKEGTEVLTETHIQEFKLPIVLGPKKEIKEAFAPICGSYTVLNEDSNKEKVYVYGCGYFFRKEEKKINDSFYIEAIIDQYKCGYRAGKKIIKMDLFYLNKHLSYLKSGL